MDASDPSTVWATQAYFVGPEQADANILGGNSSADSGAVAAVRVDRQEEEGEIDDIVRLANQADMAHQQAGNNGSPANGANGNAVMETTAYAAMAGVTIGMM